MNNGEDDDADLYETSPEELQANLEDIFYRTCYCKVQRFNNLKDAEYVANHENQHCICGCTWRVERVSYEWIAIPDLSKPLEKERPK